MASNDADRYLASHFAEVASENEEEARRLRTLGPRVIPREDGQEMVAQAEACARVAEAARRAASAYGAPDCEGQ